MLFNGFNTLYIYILPKFYEFMAQYSDEYANINMQEIMNAQPQKQQLLTMLAAIAPFAAGGLVLSWLLLKAIASINGRTLTWASLCGAKEETVQTKPVNIFLILGWAFCLAMAVGAMQG